MSDPTEAPLGVPLEAGGNAGLSADGRYRWWLTRWWRPVAQPSERCCWVMLNPSTADASVDDPTIRRCIGFSKAWGFNGLVVVNLFALRATDPRELAKAHAPVGHMNLDYIEDWITSSGTVVAAWGGSYPNAYARHIREVADLLREHKALCLGKIGSGEPRHPLYVKGDTALVAL